MNTLITDDLFNTILVDPVRRGARELFAVSGYASASMITKHFEAISGELKSEISVDLHIGMTGRDGLPRATVLGLQAIPRQISGQNFNCTITTNGRSNHSKIYVWCDNKGPIEAFIGSSNYTQIGFGVASNAATHRETCVSINPDEAFEYVMSASKGSIGYLDIDLPKYVELTDEVPSAKFLSLASASVILPLVQAAGANAGQVHSKSGLNWGQRQNREPNQAYIPIPSIVAKQEFFPAKGVHFQVTTSDGQAFMCRVAQDGNKAIETPFDNSILGKYFRERLGVPFGDFVSTEDLIRFGSNAVLFRKISQESYLMEFEPGISYET
jgi:hypothetical protein